MFLVGPDVNVFRIANLAILQEEAAPLVFTEQSGKALWLGYRKFDPVPQLQFLLGVFELGCIRKSGYSL